MMTNVPARRERAYNHLRPIIEERLQCETEHGNDWEGRPVSVKLQRRI